MWKKKKKNGWTLSRKMEFNIRNWQWWLLFDHEARKQFNWKWTFVEGSSIEGSLIFLIFRLFEISDVQMEKQKRRLMQQEMVGIVDGFLISCVLYQYLCLMFSVWHVFRWCFGNFGSVSGSVVIWGWCCSWGTLQAFSCWILN